MESSIRLATDADVSAITDLYRPIVESTAISFETEPPSTDEMRARLHETLVMYPWIVMDRSGQIGGYAYATRHRLRAGYQWSVDTSIFVHPGFRRSGVGLALYASLFAILAAQGYVNAYAGIALPNPASVALHERAGFEPLCVYRRVGYKFGSWHDVGWWELALGAHETRPSNPLPLRAVQERAEWPELLAAGMSRLRAPDTTP